MYGGGENYGSRSGLVCLFLPGCCPGKASATALRCAGVLGGIKGVGKGIGGTVYYPLKGVALAAEDIGLSAVNAGVLLKTKGGEQYTGAKKGIG